MVPRIPSWTKGVAVAVLPVPPRPFVDKRCCSCSSPWSLRGPSWTKGVAVAVLRVPPWPFVDKRCCSSSQFSVVLRSPCPFVDKRCCSCSSPCPSVALRGQKVLQLQFSVSLRGPSWTKGVAVAVLRGPSVALRGQKVLQLQFSVSLRGSSWTKGVAVLQFSVSLRGSSWTKGVAVAVLRVPPWPFVDKRCCSCSSPCPSVALRGQKVLQLQFSVSLRVPSWTKSVAVAVLRGPGRGPSWTKGVAVAVLRVPPWIKKPFFLPHRVY